MHTPAFLRCRSDRFAGVEARLAAHLEEQGPGDDRRVALVVDQLGRFADGDQTSSDVVAVQAVFGTTFLLLGVMQGLLGWTPGRWLVRHRVIVDDGEDHPRGVIEYPEQDRHTLVPGFVEAALTHQAQRVADAQAATT